MFSGQWTNPFHSMNTSELEKFCRQITHALVIVAVRDRDVSNNFALMHQIETFIKLEKSEKNNSELHRVEEIGILVGYNVKRVTTLSCWLNNSIVYIAKNVFYEEGYILFGKTSSHFPSLLAAMTVNFPLKELNTTTEMFHNMFKTRVKREGKYIVVLNNFFEYLIFISEKTFFFKCTMHGNKQWPIRDFFSVRGIPSKTFLL